ncbi:MAG: class I SAM-dependent methyltransferase [Raineya sp.]|jgi:ubiquinone/menaquinone biosynthesis C-methylase UbiE|nr:class I SAM-dependent methyltransferase [Raineya sp.]
MSSILYAQNHQNHQGEANNYMNQSQFDKLVERFENAERVQWQKPEQVIAFLGLSKEKIVLDIGAGTGYFVFRIANLCKQVIATDVDNRFLEYIEKKNQTAKHSNIVTRKAEYNTPPILENEADIVYNVNVYHHIENRKQYFEQLYQKMKKGSTLVIVDFKKGDFPQGPPDSMKLSEKQVWEELKSVGFKKIKIDVKTLPYQYMIKVKK